MSRSILLLLLLNFLLVSSVLLAQGNESSTSTSALTESELELLSLESKISSMDLLSHETAQKEVSSLEDSLHDAIEAHQDAKDEHQALIETAETSPVNSTVSSGDVSSLSSEVDNNLAEIATAEAREKAFRQEIEKRRAKLREAREKANYLLNKLLLMLN